MSISNQSLASIALGVILVGASPLAFAKSNNGQGQGQGTTPTLLSAPGAAGDCLSPSVSFGSPAATLGAISPNLVDASNMTLGGMAADGCAALYDVHSVVTGDASERAFVQAVYDVANWGDGDGVDNPASFLGPEKQAGDGSSAGSTSLYGIDWTLSGSGNSWAIQYSSSSPLTRQFDLLLYMKQGTGAAVFFFDDKLFSTDGSTAGTYRVDWCPNDLTGMDSACENLPLFSHLSLFVGNPTEVTLLCENGPCASDRVPLPGTLALIGVAALSMGSARLRRKPRA